MTIVSQNEETDKSFCIACVRNCCMYSSEKFNLPFRDYQWVSLTLILELLQHSFARLLSSYPQLNSCYSLLYGSLTDAYKSQRAILSWHEAGPPKRSYLGAHQAATSQPTIHAFLGITSIAPHPINQKILSKSKD